MKKKKRIKEKKQHTTTKGIKTSDTEVRKSDIMKEYLSKRNLSSSTYSFETIALKLQL